MEAHQTVDRGDERIERGKAPPDGRIGEDWRRLETIGDVYDLHLAGREGEFLNVTVDRQPADFV